MLLLDTTVLNKHVKSDVNKDEMSYAALSLQYYAQ